MWPQEHKLFLWATLSSFLAAFLLLDITSSAIKLVLGIGVMFSGSIFFSDLPFLTRYIVSTTIHILTDLRLTMGFSLVHDLITLFAVIVLGHLPSAWLPVMDNPWAFQFLHEFWAKRWHHCISCFVRFSLYLETYLGARLMAMLALCLACSWCLASSTNALSSRWNASGTRSSLSSSSCKVFQSSVSAFGKS